MRKREIEQLAERAKAALEPLDKWAQQCHAASLALVREGIGGRVARGWCKGVTSQHSWAVLGMDCYARGVVVIDATLWSYRDDVRGVYVGPATRYGHQPHGAGDIWRWGRPKPPAGAKPIITLTPREPLSEDAKFFLELLGPLDYDGWLALGSAPVGNWPAGEIFAAMVDTPGLEFAVPIDKLGMTTDRNPSGLYLPGGEKKLPRRRREAA